ncbi:MAG: hypothetical protein MJA83_05535, partial [Gammaproteobacteria bacterium]|nr:hypothetical protein [Gammaproteobacteria bacterium]
GDCLATSNLVHETLHFLEDVLAGVTPSTMLDVEHDRRLFMRDDNKKELPSEELVSRLLWDLYCKPPI